MMLKTPNEHSIVHVGETSYVGDPIWCRRPVSVLRFIAGVEKGDRENAVFGLARKCDMLTR